MAASKSDIKFWFEQGVKKGATHLIVVCDTFDYEDYPVYVMPVEYVREIESQNNNEGECKRVMEVYNLHLPMQSQLNTFRPFNY